MKRTRYQVPIKTNKSFTLNITSMTDMFTILLVFLLQSFTSSEVHIEPVSGLRLPSSSTEKNPVDGVKISITKNELSAEKKLLSHIANNEFDKTSLSSTDEDFIQPLFDELQKINKENLKIAESGKILLLADQDLPYSLLKKVLYTASMAGFPNLKLVTTAGQ